MKKQKAPKYIFFRVLLSISILYGVLMAPMALFLVLSNAPETIQEIAKNETIATTDSLSTDENSDSGLRVVLFENKEKSLGWNFSSEENIDKSFNKKHEHKTGWFTFICIVIAFAINYPFKRYLRRKRKNKPISERLDRYCKKYLQYMHLINTGILILVLLVYHIAEYYSIQAPDAFSSEIEKKLSTSYFYISIITSILVILFLYHRLKHRFHFKYITHFFDKEPLKKSIFKFRSEKILFRVLALTGMTTFIPIAVISTYIILSITTLSSANIETINEEHGKVLLGSYYDIITNKDADLSENYKNLPYIPSISTLIMLVGIATNILVTLIYILFFVKWTSKSIKIPISELLATMKEVSSGKWGETTSVRTNDEIGKLTVGFNEMSAHLKQYYDEVTDLNKNLEQKVIERTAKIEQQKEEIISQRDEIEAQRDEIEAQRDSVMKQRDEIITQKKEITDSIEYAKLIQTALFPPIVSLTKHFPENFILFKPKDIVSGDFYWIHEKNNQLVVFVGDCTGHGVPGAFMSMLGISLLNEIIHSREKANATEILNKLRELVIESFHQSAKTGETKDGMDVSLLIIDTISQKEGDKEFYNCQFAGANNPLYIVKSEKLKVKSDVIANEERMKQSEKDYVTNVRNDEILIEVKGDKMPIAVHDKMDSFTSHELKIFKGDSIYMFSDGYADQFGGSNGKKFKYKKFKETLLNNQAHSMISQKEILNNTITKWQGDLDQIDDILVLGIKF